MSIIHTYISSAERQRLSVKDNDYLRQKLDDNCRLNRLLNKPINKVLLAELLCVLDRQPIARRKAEQRSSKVRVFRDGKMVRIEHGNGKMMRVVS